MKTIRHKQKKIKNIVNKKGLTVCICASTRFEEEIKQYKKFIEGLGIKCLIPNMRIPKEKVSDLLQVGLIYEHFEKIKQSDIVLILNPGGYVGTSVINEIGYAKALNKKIIFTYKTNKAEIDCLADIIIEK